MTSLYRLGIGILVIGAVCGGCMKEDLGTNVPHKAHALTGPKKGGGADLDLLPAPPGMKTGTPSNVGTSVK